ncbi:Glu-tRNA(Gln) amidotransferase subunit GatD [Candidatus Woesearchaeota archaeon]|nr:Glu-tRNA(Gln) amidotransferase subunit GatD [Candidatus Woesearchaeota archaeon]
MQVGDHVIIETIKGSYDGVLVQDEKDKVFLKLNTGYNAGFDKKNIKKSSVLAKHVEKERKKVVLKQLKNMPTISILHTGGTIASKVDYSTGAVYNKFTPEDMLVMFPELFSMANISSRLIRNMSSDDMRFSHYNIIAKAIAEEIKKGVKGIIITHGTDTLHYTAAALSFVLENISVPVILVGSQRSSDRPSTDAAMNLLCAVVFITQTNYSGVAICMHEESSDTTALVLPAAKSRKMHTSKRSAFKVINGSPIAHVDYKTKKVSWYKEHDKFEGSFSLRLFNEKLKVGLVKVHTNMYASEFQAYKGFDGLVIEGTGLGHAPINEIDEYTKEHAKIFSTIKDLIKEGTLIVMSSQTIFGSIDMNVYTPGRRLVEIGVLGNYTDTIPETAFIKLAWLLSNYKKEEASRLFNQNFRGEISKSLSYETD